MKKILYISNSAHLGGGNKSIITIIKEMQSKDIDCLIMVPEKGKLSELLDQLSYPYRIQKTQLYVLNKFKIIYWLFRYTLILWNYKPDLIHVNDIHCFRFIGRFSKLFKIPVICHMRHFATKPMLEFMMDSTPELFLFNSEYNQNKTEKELYALNLSNIPSKVAYNFFNKDDYYQPELRTLTRKRFNVNDETIHLVLVGNINPLKGHLIFIDSIIELQNNHNLTQKIQILIVGEDVTDSGILKASKQKVKEAKLDEIIKFSGFMDNTAAAYASADIVIIPSEEEPFGRVAVEAILAKKQVVAFNNSGLKEILEPLTTPILIDSPHAKDLSLGILQAIEKPNSESDVFKDAEIIAEKFSAAIQGKFLYEQYNLVSKRDKHS